MGALVAADAVGVYVSVECDTVGCGAHVTLRPFDQIPPLDLLHEAVSIAVDEGWRLSGVALCPSHGVALADALTATVAEGVEWVTVTDERPSMALRPS